MGSYAGLNIRGQELLWWKNGLSPTATSLFTKEDIHRGKGKAGLKLIKQYGLTGYGDNYTVEDINLEIVLATVDVATLRQRLSIYGYGQSMFNDTISRAIDNAQEMFDDSDNDMKQHYAKDIETLKKLQSNAIPLAGISYKLFEDLNFYDELAIIWTALQNKEIKDSDLVIIDLDDLVQGGWLDYEFSNTDSNYLISEGVFISEAPILITEGVSDERFLRESLQIIYPKLVDNVRFLDSSFKPERSASSAIKMVKSFSSAGINNRILVILDNDAAASDALKDLPDSLPGNIKVIQYPALEWLRSYPTIGPQGEIDMDINGLAGSIEMYLGKDVLIEGSGELAKIQWRDYMNRAKKYQGSLIDKTGVQDRFETKDKSDIDKWKDLKFVWDYIIEQLAT